MLQQLTNPLYPGSSVTITFTFAQAGQTTLNVPVQNTATPHDVTLTGNASASAGD